jgi:hypothetical protein
MDPTPRPGSPFDTESRASSQPTLPSALRGSQSSSNQVMGTESVPPGPSADTFAVDGMQMNREPRAGESGPSLVPAAARGRDDAHDRPSPWPARIALAIEVMVWFELGLILIFVPWRRAWTDNSLILNFPHLREFLAMNFVRGAVTGIGLLDLWMGISRAVYYKDPGKG